MSLAFTLVELLVGIGILAILATLIFSAAGKIRKEAETAKCLSNIRQYGLAVLTMAADQGGLRYWDGKDSPTTETGRPQFWKWLAYDGDYLPKEPPLRCPIGDKPAMKGVLDNFRFPYAGNQNLCHYYPRLIGIPAPSHRVVLAAEYTWWDGFNTAGGFNRMIWNGGPVGGPEGTYRPIPGYHGNSQKRGLHFFFLDGSAKLVFPTDNDWTKPPTCAPTSGRAPEGYFFTSAHFQNLKKGTLIAQ